VDELGRAIPALETLARLAKTCASIGAQLGLSPAAEHSFRINNTQQAAYDKWLRIADAVDEETVESAPAAPADSVPEPRSVSR
jgi:hypothetical protein